MKTLLNAVNNSKFRIVGFELSPEDRRRLINMGIFANDLYERTNGNSNGPIIIRNISSNSTAIAIGNKLAEGIIIEIELK